MKYLILLTFVFFLTGCKSEEQSPAKTKQNKKYVIKDIDETQLNNIINDRKGKVLFINVWATWCVPCVEEFPDIIKVAQFYKDKDVDFLSLNVDMSSQVDSLVTPFLNNFDAEFTVYNVKEKSAEKVINLLNPEWSGAIPATFIYDRNGNRKVFILGSEKYQNFSSALDSVRSINVL